MIGECNKLGLFEQFSLLIYVFIYAGEANYYLFGRVLGWGPGCFKSGYSSHRPLPTLAFSNSKCDLVNRFGQLVDRYLWINNIPNGSIPFLTSNAGIQFTDFTGLVPGMMEDLGALNPMEIIKGFMEGNNPPCKQISMNTVGQPPGGPNTESKKNFHVACGDIANIAPCDFPGGGGNPVTKVPCRATFTTLGDMKDQGLDTSFRKKRSPLTKANYNNIYIFVCGLLLIYLVQKLLKKN